MRQTTRKWAPLAMRAALFGILALGGVTMAGCGEEDPCANKTCEFGTCDSTSGQCVNVESCNVDSECVPGYLCQENGTCVAQNTCEQDSDCSTGVCEEGACVNPDSCTEDTDCLSRTYCGDGGSCRADPCNNVQCQRGVCQRGTDNCVSASSCTERTEAIDCVAGEKCVEGSCEGSETYCDNLTCERGVCSFAEDGCVNAMNCEGSDANCREGFFCNDMNACQPNLCVQNNVDCGDDGVCMPSSGQCTNAEVCTSSSQCTGSDLCVSEGEPANEGVCLPEPNACGDANGDGGCPGNQICEYDGDTLEAECAEPEVCQTSVDCKDGRQCGGQTCLAQISCQSDRLEPNNTMEEATVFTDVAENLQVSGSLCQGDTDNFTFQTTNIVDPTTSGTIVVSINVPQRDLGLGTLTATLTGPGGNQLGSGSLSMLADDGTVRLTTSLGIPDHGTYSVSIQPGGQMSSAGLNYDMAVNVVPQGSVQACDEAQVITPGQRITGNTEDAATSGIGATCLGDDESSSESIYALQLDESRDVTITAEPLASDSEAVVSLRSRCLEAASEVECSNENGEGSAESVSTVLAAGTHYIIVQAPADGTLGAFELTVDSPYATTCGPGDSYCVDGSTSSVCTRGGGRFAQISCDEQCNPSTGECFPPAGDRCGDAPQISSESMSQMDEIDLRQYNNNYSLSQGGCIDGQPRTGGPDAAYSVTIPPNTTMTAAVSYGAGAQGALYLVDDCSDVQGTCQKGQQGDDDTPSEEEIFFRNTTDSEVTKTLIVDTAAEQRLGETQVNFSYAPIVCEPGTGQCNMAGNTEICNEKGTGIGNVNTCSAFACENGYCPGDTCAQPYNITQAALADGGTTFNKNWTDFSNDYNFDDTCGSGENIDDIDTDGPDPVFEVDLQPYETLNLDGNAPGEDLSIYIKTQMDCGSPNTPCLAANEEEGPDNSLSYTAKSAETVYVILDHENTGGGSFTLDAEITQPECVPPNYSVNCDGSGNLQYCDTSGTIQSYACTGGCSNGTCGTPTGGIPQDAKPMGDGDSDSNTWDGVNAVDPSTASNTGSCSFSQGTAGADFTYEISLQANETLTASFTGNSCCDIMYIMKDPSDASTCQDLSDNDGSASYTAGSSPETVYVIMDHDSYTSSSFWDYTLNITIN